MLQILWQAVREKPLQRIWQVVYATGYARQKPMAIHNTAAEKAGFALLCAARANFPWSITECQSSVKVFAHGQSQD